MWKENQTTSLMSPPSGCGNRLHAQAGIEWVTALLLEPSTQEEETEGFLKPERLELG